MSQPRAAAAVPHRSADEPGCAAAGPIDPLLQSRLPSLDGLRFLAAVLVIVYHGGCEAPAPDGVTFFFVLSGFLFAVLLDREFRSTGTIGLGSFYIRRAIRILPAFYATLAITIVGKLLLGNPLDYAHAAASGLFVGNYYNALHDHPPTGFAHYWSLAVEEQFYIVWPLTFLALSRISRGALLGFLGASIVGVGAWRTTALWTGIGHDPYAYNAFECRFDSLATGCLVGLLIQSSRFRSLVRKSCPTGLEPLAVIGALVWSSAQSSHFHHGPGFTLDSALMALLLLQLVLLAEHPLWSWLNWEPIRFLGTLSYSAYLLHAWGLAVAAKVPGLSLAGRIVVGIAATFVLAAGQYFVVERPALRYRERFRSHGGEPRHADSRSTVAAEEPAAIDVATGGAKPQPLSTGPTHVVAPTAPLPQEPCRAEQLAATIR